MSVTGNPVIIQNRLGQEERINWVRLFWRDFMRPVVELRWSSGIRGFFGVLG